MPTMTRVIYSGDTWDWWETVQGDNVPRLVWYVFNELMRGQFTERPFASPAYIPEQEFEPFLDWCKSQPGWFDGDDCPISMVVDGRFAPDTIHDFIGTIFYVDPKNRIWWVGDDMGNPERPHRVFFVPDDTEVVGVDELPDDIKRRLKATKAHAATLGTEFDECLPDDWANLV